MRVFKHKLKDICVLEISNQHKGNFSIRTIFMFVVNRVAWINYLLSVTILVLLMCIGCLVYAKYNQCDPLQGNLISRPDQVKEYEESIRINVFFSDVSIIYHRNIGTSTWFNRSLHILYIECHVEYIFKWNE